jgi:hypothetical protein
LNIKGLFPIDIHNNFVETLALEAVVYSTMTKYLRTRSFRENEGDGIQDQESSIREVAAAILKAFADEPFLQCEN